MEPGGTSSQATHRSRRPRGRRWNEERHAEWSREVPRLRPPTDRAGPGDAATMIELFKNPNYDFIGKRKWAYYVSIAITLTGLISLVAQGGLRYDIDFTGGTLIQVRFEQAPSVAQIRSSLSAIHLGESVIQRFGDEREFIVRLPLKGLASEEVSRLVQ